MWKLAFPETLFQDLVQFLFSTAPSENGCFLLANSFRSKNGGSILTITRILKPEHNSWNRSGEHSLEPSSRYINDCAVCADNTKESLIFVHTHPSSLHPLRFSPVDDESNEKIFNVLSKILPERPLGSIVFSRHGIYGLIFSEGRSQTISATKISGQLLSEVPMDEHKKENFEIDSVFDRQAKVMGPEGQLKLQELKIVIVGVGGTGSSVAVQLARMGVRKLTLIDKDVIDTSNISRVYGSKKSDIGKPKVDVLKTHLATFSRTEIVAICTDIVKEDTTANLVDADIIFGCTDNLSSRSILNDVSVQYYIPLIDVGCRITNKGNTVDQILAKVQLVTPVHACLWCSGTLNGKIILQESLSEDEKESLSKEGYYDNIEKQPSIISLTTLAASLGINKLLGLLGILGEQYGSRTQIDVKTGFMVEDTPTIDPNCICHKRRGKADSRKIA